MNKQLEDVAVFHRTYKQPILNTPQIPSLKRCELRYELIKEELGEFKEAYESGDLVKCADALVDLSYVINGSYLEFGLGNIQEELFDEVQKSNMSKLDINGEVLYHPTGKVKKSDLFKEPDLKSIIDRLNII